MSKISFIQSEANKYMVTTAVALLHPFLGKALNLKNVSRYYDTIKALFRVDIKGKYHIIMRCTRNPKISFKVKQLCVSCEIKMLI